MINLDTAKFCIWGYKNVNAQQEYRTFSHIFAAFYRALEAMGKKVIWLDGQDNLADIDFSNTFFISMDEVVVREAKRLPRRQDCFYAVHNGDQRVRNALGDLDLLSYGVHVRTRASLDPRVPEPQPLTTRVDLAPDTPFFPESNVVTFFWASDLLPQEIEKNKPSQVFNKNSQVVNWVASVWQGAEGQFREFERACHESGIRTEWYGYGRRGVVSIEEHARLIRDSYIAPALVSQDQYNVGYLPCRIFKNISYGQYGVTNSEFVNDVFDGRLICNRDSRQLFYDAREKLPNVLLTDLHSLMDYVAQNHTFLNRVDALLKAARLVLENK
jgi:hypothetical protein